MPDLEISIANSSIVHVFQSQNYFWCIEPYLEIQNRTGEIVLWAKKSDMQYGPQKYPLKKIQFLTAFSTWNLS